MIFTPRMTMMMGLYPGGVALVTATVALLSLTGHALGQQTGCSFHCLTQPCGAPIQLVNKSFILRAAADSEVGAACE